jgi:hypothetical protein
VSSEQRPGQRHKLQNSSKTLLKEKERKVRKKKRKALLALPDGKEALMSKALLKEKKDV